LPSVLVEQVQQLKPNALASAYNEGKLTVLNESVDFVYLPLLLGQRNIVPMAQRYSPVIAIRSGGRRVALHVDEVVGNQEVVVKNVGPQLARMIGIAGATVLGSGDIVLILDPVQLVGRVDLRVEDSAASRTGAVAEIVEEPTRTRTETALSTAPVVMVVDDSVTVRRVTQRLLVREGYQVVLAKDGVDALEQIQEFAPDIMLVDIEMPRMDGFDLTRNVRSDIRTREIPIVMITSRTADKHRNVAMSLGVDMYLGKPYQEAELLTSVKSLLEKRGMALPTH
jgi:chemosensory pili system protein ChpA (sensor histidine kinase/response regulator)